MRLVRGPSNVPGFARGVRAAHPVLASLIRYAYISPYAPHFARSELVSAACFAYLRARAGFDPARGGLLKYATLHVRSRLTRDLTLRYSLKTWRSVSPLARHLRYQDHDEQLAAWLEPVEYDDDEHAPEAPDPSPEEQLAAAERGALVRRLVAECRTLTPRERRLVAERWLAPIRPTLAKVGARFGVSRERIRQIEVSALRKLRKGAVALGLTIS